MGRLALILATIGTLLVPATARAEEVSLRMDDGVRIDSALLEPEGAAPADGWPAVMMFHGLGGNHTDLVPLAQAFVSKGYAVLVPDARGHGTSEGFVSLDGPREVADVRTEFQWLATRPEVSDTRIGAWGISLGGGAAWNSVVAGVPFAALETVETWSDLYGALFPQNLGKAGAIYGFAQSVPTARIQPELRSLVPQMISSENLGTVSQVLGTRSSLRFLSAVRTPSLLFQGRRDFAFGIDQAAAAYRTLAGPKRLYLGDFGHAPSTFPGPDLDYVLSLGARWYDRFLKDAPNGVDTEKPVEVAPNPWTGAPKAFSTFPRTASLTIQARTRARIGAAGKAIVALKLPRRTLEQLGPPVLRVTASSRTSWTHLVAVLVGTGPDGSETILSEGGAATAFGPRPSTVTIRLISDANLLRKGTKLRLYLGGTSTIQSLANLLYLKPVATGSTLALRSVRLTLPVLATTISR